MANTHEGAMKSLAKKRNMALKELLLKLKTHNFCHKCNTWKLHNEFGIDNSRFNNLHRRCFQCRHVKERKSLKGRTSSFRGKKHTQASKKKMSIARKGNQNRKGKPFTPDQLEYLRQQTIKATPRGKDHPNWKGGMTREQYRDRYGLTPEYIVWRRSVYQRDNYTCQHCGDSRGGNLNAHHIKEWSKYPDHRYELDNGITLCVTCHRKVHYGDNSKNSQKSN